MPQRSRYLQGTEMRALVGGKPVLIRSLEVNDQGGNRVVTDPPVPNGTEINLHWEAGEGRYFNMQFNANVTGEIGELLPTPSVLPRDAARAKIREMEAMAAAEGPQERVQNPLEVHAAGMLRTMAPIVEAAAYRLQAVPAPEDHIFYPASASYVGRPDSMTFTNAPPFDPPAITVESIRQLRDKFLRERGAREPAITYPTFPFRPPPLPVSGTYRETWEREAAAILRAEAAADEVLREPRPRSEMETHELYVTPDGAVEYLGLEKIGGVIARPEGIVERVPGMKVGPGAIVYNPAYRCKKLVTYRAPKGLKQWQVELCVRSQYLRGEIDPWAE